MGIHRPSYIKTAQGTVYRKYEFNDDFLYRRTRSISINAENLRKEGVTGVAVELCHRGVLVFASRKDIEAYKDVLTFKTKLHPGGEVKYYYPVEKWKVMRGDKDWVSKLGAA